MTDLPNVLRRLTGAPEIVRFHRSKTAVVLIDFQAEHFTGALPVADADSVVDATVRLNEWAEKHKIKTVFVRHTAKSPASPVFAPESEAAEPYPPAVVPKKCETVTKYGESAFSGSILQTVLMSADIDTLVFAGMTAAGAVTATVADAQSLGYRCVVAADATAERDMMSWDLTRVVGAAAMREAALANIADKYASVLNVAAIMALPIEK